jgi:outer membrane protein OmpA-like peptidoglycan-associated protein
MMAEPPEKPKQPADRQGGADEPPAESGKAPGQGGGGANGGDVVKDEEPPKPAHDSTTAETSGGKVSSALVDAAVKVIAYLATGAGFITFVGVTGAAVTWMRLNAAELPATQALQLVGIKYLVADGAIALVAFVVLGLIAVTVTFVIDGPGRDTDEMRHGLTALAVIESLIAIWVADAYLDLGHVWLATAGIVAFGVFVIAISLLPERIKPPPKRDGAWRWLRQETLGKWIAEAELLPRTMAQLRADKERRDLVRELGLDPEERPAERWRKTVKLWPMVALAVGAGIVGVVYALTYHEWVGVAIVLAWVLSGICFGVARTTDVFWPYGLAVFFSVALFGACLNVLRLSDAPELSPAALLRTGNSGTSGTVGLYIARTDDRYWLGAVTMTCTKKDGKLVPDHLQAGSGRIFSIPRSQVVDDAVGARTAPAAAGERALDLLSELVRRQPAGGAPPPEPAAAPSTTTTTTTGSPAAAPASTARAATSEDLTADSPAAVPSTLAVTGKCLHLPPRLIRLNPATAAPGDPVEIIGTDLGTSGTVTLNGTDVEAKPWEDQSVVLRVPASGARSGRVVVRTRDRASNGVVLTVAQSNAPPVAVFSVRRDRAATRTFTLDGRQSTDPEKGPLTYRWRSRGRSFGTGGTARITLPRGQTTTRVTLTVTDDHNQKSEAQRTLRRGVERFTLSNDEAFDFGAASLTVEGKRRLERLRSDLRGQVTAIRRIEISGYADFAGAAAFNQELSMQRAQTVRAALLKGLAVLPRRVRVTGYGEPRARAHTWNDPRRARDRRVDINVTLVR